MRLRIRVIDWPRRSLVLADTPRPDCLVCEGLGDIEHPFGDENGEYAGSDWEPCGCWDSSRRWTLLPLHRRLRRTPPGGYSSEPPF